MITHLPQVHPPHPEDTPPGHAADHPMRAVTRAVAFEDGWTAETRGFVARFFDDVAPTWDQRDLPGRDLPLVDLLDRGLAAAPVADRRLAVDLGGGTGVYQQQLAAAFERVIAVDLAMEMLRHAVRGVTERVQADASRLPLADGSVDVLALQNMFLFPAEVDRVLAPAGLVAWINSRGPGTPIHLTAEEVDEVLPGRWDGVASTAGWGTWSLHWRS